MVIDNVIIGCIFTPETNTKTKYYEYSGFKIRNKRNKKRI